MKARKLVITVLVIVILAQLVAVEANPYHFITSPVIELRSPCSSNYGISSLQRPFQYNTNHFNISLDYIIPKNYSSIDAFTFKIDNGPMQSINITNIRADFYYGDAMSYSIFSAVENLSNGIYNLLVYAQFANGTTTQIMDAYVKIDSSPQLDPLFPLTVSLVALAILVLAVGLFLSKNIIKRNKEIPSSK